MKFNFEPFLATKGSYAERVSIRSNGSIGFSQGLMRKRDLTNGVWYVCLFFDKERQAIGLRFTENPDEPGTTKLHARKVVSKDGVENWSGHAAARAFLDFYGIEFEKRDRRSFRPEWNDDFQGLVIVLSKGEAAEPEEEEQDLGPGDGDAKEKPS
jgi:hypothetical protein